MTSTAASQPPPEAIMPAPTAPVRASTEPTDKSMPPDRMTTVMPAAKMALMATCRVTFMRLADVRNRSLKRDARSIMASRTSSMPSRRSNWREDPPVCCSSRLMVGSPCGVSPDLLLRRLGRVQLGHDAPFVHDVNAIAEVDDLGQFRGDHQDGFAVRGQLVDEPVHFRLRAHVDAA